MFYQISNSGGNSQSWFWWYPSKNVLVFSMNLHILLRFSKSISHLVMLPPWKLFTSWNILMQNTFFYGLICIFFCACHSQHIFWSRINCLTNRKHFIGTVVTWRRTKFMRKKNKLESSIWMLGNYFNAS